MRSYIWVLKARPILRARLPIARGKVAEGVTSIKTSRPNYHALSNRTIHSNTVLPNLNIVRSLPAPLQAPSMLRATSHMYLQLISLLTMYISQAMEGGLRGHHRKHIRLHISLPNPLLRLHGRMSCDMIIACHLRLAQTQE